MLSGFDIKRICQASISSMFDCDIPHDAVVYAAMAQVNYENRVYSEGDVKLIEFIFNNRDLYPELFKKEEK